MSWGVEHVHEQAEPSLKSKGRLIKVRIESQGRTVEVGTPLKFVRATMDLIITFRLLALRT
jgi:hypothetical protein